jgi:hypothetical protein
MFQPRDFFIEGISQKVPLYEIRYTFENIFERHLIRDIHCHLHNEGDYVTTMDVSIHLSQDYIHGAEAFFQELHEQGFVSVVIERQTYRVHINSWTSFPKPNGLYITPEVYESMRYPSLYIKNVIDTEWHIQQILCYLFIHPSNVYSMRFIPNPDGTFALFIHPRQNIPSNSKITRMYKKIKVDGFIPVDFESHKSRLPLNEKIEFENDGIKSFIYTYKVILASNAPLKHLEKIKNFRRCRKPSTK